MLKVGVCVGDGNNGGRKPVACVATVGHGKADAVDGNAAFGDDVASNGRANIAKGNFPGVGSPFGAIKLAEAVYMSGNKMAANFAAYSE